MLYKIDFYAGETLKNKSTSTRENACRGTRLVGIVRFERTHEGVKVPCLTAWLYPSIEAARTPRSPFNEKGTGEPYAFNIWGG